MRLKLFIIALLALFVAGCTREPIPAIEEKEESIVTIDVAISPETRVAYNGGTGDNALSWEIGDQLLLAGYNGTTYKGSEVFTYSGTGNKFTGSTVVGTTTYKAYYPANIITLDTDGNVNPLGVAFWQQTQNGDGTTGHLKNKLLLYDETPNAIDDGFALNLKSSILKLSLSGIPAAVGTLNKLIYKVETASGIFKSVELNVTNATFSSDKTTLTAYIAFDPSVVTGIVAGGTVKIILLGAKSYKWSATSTNGKTYVAGKCYPGTVTTGWDVFVVSNPLSYFAEHNMADLNGTFETGHNTSGLYLFNWNNAMTYNTTPATLGNKQYYLPTIQEWGTIIPQSYSYVNFNGSGTRTLSNASVTIGSENYTMSGTFGNTGNVVYATLTYTHQSYPTLYAIARYRTENMSAGNADARMVIDMQLTATPYTIDQAKNTDWNSIGVVSRVFPAAGWRDSRGTLDSQGTYGNYWSSTERSGTLAWYIYFGSDRARSGSYCDNINGFSVRLISRE